MTARQSRDLCVEHNVRFSDGDPIETIKNVETAELCKSACVKSTECNYYHWSGSSKEGGKYCALYDNDDGVNRLWKKGDVSGSLTGLCRDLLLSQLRECECVTVGKCEPSSISSVDTRTIDDSTDTANQCGDKKSLRCYSKRDE